jgi:hypothetical protein
MGLEIRRAARRMPVMDSLYYLYYSIFIQCKSTTGMRRAARRISKPMPSPGRAHGLG